MTVILPSSVENTVLWQRLKSGFSGADDSIAQALSTNISSLCVEAANRMRGFPSLHPQYTLHDEVHLLRVTELMAQIVPIEVLEKLNPIEIALLILAAFFHDQGMVPDANELARWREGSIDPDPNFSLFRDNWAIEHPNLEAVRRQLNDYSIGEVEKQQYRQAESDLLSALLSDYLRETHGERSAFLLKSKYDSDPRLRIQNTNLVGPLAKLCQSHVRSTSDLTESNGFHVDEQIGTYRINTVYLALVLRLADIVDFDRERTPDSLYRTIDFHSHISLQEWEKHRSVEAWSITPELVQFTIHCEHPEYERAVRKFIDYIDAELQNALQCTREFPARVGHYKFNLPSKVDRSRIAPKNNSYIYHDLEFSLSRDEIVKLLMTDKLYGSPSLCVRELLQNSLDALRHRTALFKCNESDWNNGKIEMFHEVNADGHEVVRCVDNGIGMTRDIILNFLTKAGRSYYRSPQFEQERISLRAAKVDFDPCAQFGIGFMSCFMIGDHIVVNTRRDNGSNRGYGEPLVVEISGVGGIVVLRQGDKNQPVGTTVTIVGRKKPRFLDSYNDQVQLIGTLTDVALATEFPINAKCSVDGIENSVSIPPFPSKQLTLMEQKNLKSIRTFEQDFQDINPHLSGHIRASFLINETGELVLENEEAKWSMDGYQRDCRLQIKSEHQEGDGAAFHFSRQEVEEELSYQSPIALDGILVEGEPGRADILPQRRHYTRSNRAEYSASVGRARFLLDVRGHIKPPLSPDRTPLFVDDDSGPKWEFIESCVYQAQGRLWEQIATFVDAHSHPEVFWNLSIIYNGLDTSFVHLRLQPLWNWFSVPVSLEGEMYQWKRLPDIGSVQIFPQGDNFTLHPVSGGRIGICQPLANWLPHIQTRTGKREPNISYVERDLRITVAACSTLSLHDGNPILEFQAPSDPDQCPYNHILAPTQYGRDTLMLNYSSELSTLLSVHSPCRSVNKRHSIVAIACEGLLKEQPSEIEMFAYKVALCMSSHEVAPILLEKPNILRRWYREIGARFIDLDWSHIPLHLHPPYGVRLVNGEVIEVTGEVLENWSNAAPDPKEFW